jgi:hypothetical protein
MQSFLHGRHMVCADCCFVYRCDQSTEGGATALLLACWYGHLDVVQWLVRAAGSDARSECNDVRWQSLSIVLVDAAGVSSDALVAVALYRLVRRP